MFEPKAKEPVLSSQLQAVIKRSQGVEVSEEPALFNRSDDIYRYKYRVMRALLENEDLLRTLHHDPLSFETPLNGDSFKDICVFDYLRLPDFQEKVRNYVCFEIETQGGGNRAIEIILIIRVVCHFDDTVTDWGINRQDLLSLIISNDLDWSHLFGGITMYKTSDLADMTNKGYIFRDMTYRGQVANNYYNRIKN